MLRLYDLSGNSDCSLTGEIYVAGELLVAVLDSDLLVVFLAGWA